MTILTRFAQLEERHGDRERAKTMQELIKNFKEGGKAIDIAILESAVGGEEWSLTDQIHLASFTQNFLLFWKKLLNNIYIILSYRSANVPIHIF